MSFRELKENPTCPECQGELILCNESTHRFEKEKSGKWKEFEERIDTEYLECERCDFRVDDESEYLESLKNG